MKNKIHAVTIPIGPSGIDLDIFTLKSLTETGTLGYELLRELPVLIAASAAAAEIGAKWLDHEIAYRMYWIS
jgi:hypothetical protein